LRGRLIAAAFALVIAGGVGHAAGKTPAKEGPGVTTLAPATPDGWNSSQDPADPFTPVGVIGGPSAGADPDGPLVAPEDPPIPRAAPAKAPPPAKSAWLPEPTTWGLLLVGSAMIGFALRGLLAARRRLSRLQDLDG